MLAGKQQTVHASTAEKLSAVFGVDASYWPVERTPRPRTPVELAEELLKLRAAGAAVPRQELDQTAAALEEVARSFLDLAALLREDVAARNSTP